MADKVVLPLLLPNPPPSKPLFPVFHDHPLQLTLSFPQPQLQPLSSPSSPIAPLLLGILHLHQDPSSPQTHNPKSISRTHTRKGQSRGKPWSHHRLSTKGKQILDSLLNPELDSSSFNKILLQLFEISPVELNFTPESVSFDILGIIKGLVFRNKNEGRASFAASLLHELRNNGVIIDIYAYTSLITAYASNGRYREAVMLFNKLEQEGYTPTLITYNIILNAYGKMVVAEGHCIKKQQRCLKKWKQLGLVLIKVTYNALLDVYGKSRRPKEAMEVLKEMESSRFAPSIVSYNSLISAYARDGLLDEAMELKRQMMEKGIEHDVFTYTTLLSGFEKTGKDDCAMRVFDEMRVAGCQPNICAFNVLIKLHGKRGNFVEMMKVFEETKVCEFAPNIVTWNTLLTVSGQNGMDCEVSRVFREMERAGFVAERDTFNTLISDFSRCGSFDQPWLREAFGSSRCKPNELTYCSLLHAYVNGKEIRRVSAHAEEIYASIIEPQAMLLKTLVLVYSKSDLLMETERAFFELR
ncbi:Pentatricopeptide repeat-containing protein, partial [Cucurbita argyrosperma subsp. sororia]